MSYFLKKTEDKRQKTKKGFIFKYRKDIPKMVVGDILEAELVKLQELKKKLDKQSGGLCWEDLLLFCLDIW